MYIKTTLVVFYSSFSSCSNSSSRMVFPCVCISTPNQSFKQTTIFKCFGVSLLLQGIKTLPSAKKYALRCYYITDHGGKNRKLISPFFPPRQNINTHSSGHVKSYNRIRMSYRWCASLDCISSSEANG